MFAGWNCATHGSSCAYICLMESAWHHTARAQNILTVSTTSTVFRSLSIWRCVQRARAIICRSRMGTLLNLQEPHFVFHLQATLHVVRERRALEERVKRSTGWNMRDTFQETIKRRPINANPLYSSMGPPTTTSEYDKRFRASSWHHSGNNLKHT